MRRSVGTVAVGALAAVSCAKAAGHHPGERLTIENIIDIIRRAIPFTPLSNTVDTVKTGDPKQIATGVVTTMFATIDVINAAIAVGANLIIAHEPTFYNHSDETQWLKNDDVYKRKMALIDKHKIVIWRCHDSIHSLKPDGVMAGVLKTLGWEAYKNDNNGVISLPATTLAAMVTHLKKQLEIPTLRYIGSPDQACKTVVMMPGAAGGQRHINTIRLTRPDVFICGELQEWETSEYIRDARALGFETSLVVLGHTVSEEPGMEWLVDWLQPKIEGVTVTHVPSHNPFQWA